MHDLSDPSLPHFQAVNHSLATEIKSDHREGRASDANFPVEKEGAEEANEHEQHEHMHDHGHDHSDHDHGNHSHVKFGHTPPKAQSILIMKETVFTRWPQQKGSHHDHGLRVKNIFLISLGTGSLLGGILADIYGQKRVASKFMCFLIISGFLTSFAWSLESFTYLWFFLGTGVFGVYVVTYVRVVEVLPVKYRVPVALVLFGSSWTMARMAAIVIAWASKDWSLIVFTLSLWVCAMMMVKHVCCSKYWIIQECVFPIRHYTSISIFSTSKI